MISVQVVDTDSEHLSTMAGYTPDQEKAVIRVMKLKATDYYGHLLVEKKCTSAEIKKAYRKQALVMHPDKNHAPQADEAFKRISKAFQVLSDDDKRKIYDQTGIDPDARSGGPGFQQQANPFGGGFGNAFGGAGRSPFGNTRFRAAHPADDIFAAFFGGPPGGGAAGPQFQFQFNDGSDIFSQLFGDALFGGRARAQPRQQTRQEAENNKSEKFTTYLNVFIIAAILILPSLLGGLFGSGDNKPSMPSYRFNERAPFVQERTTPKYDVHYFVNPADVKDLPDAKLKKLDHMAENNYISFVKSACKEEYLQQQQMMHDAVGWLFTDEEKYEEARNMRLPNCMILDNLGIKLRA